MLFFAVAHSPQKAKVEIVAISDDRAKKSWTASGRVLPKWIPSGIPEEKRHVPKGSLPEGPVRLVIDPRRVIFMRVLSNGSADPPTVRLAVGDYRPWGAWVPGKEPNGKYWKARFVQEIQGSEGILDVKIGVADRPWKTVGTVWYEAKVRKSGI